MFGERWDDNDNEVEPSTSREPIVVPRSDESVRRRAFGARGRGFAPVDHGINDPDEAESQWRKDSSYKKQNGNSNARNKFNNSEDDDNPSDFNTPYKLSNSQEYKNSQRYNNCGKSNASAKGNSQEFNASKTGNYEEEAAGYEAERYEDSADDPFTDENMGVRRKQGKNFGLKRGSFNNGEKKGKSYKNPSDPQDSHNPQNRQQQKPPRQEYIPNPDPETEEDLFSGGIASGINFDNYDNIEVNVYGDHVPQKIDRFEEARVCSIVMNNIRRSSYVKPTPVQKHALPIIMNGRDMMACAQTGSGKTAAFLIPTIHCVLRRGDAPAEANMAATPQILVVTPTRELATQIYLEAKKLANGSSLKIGICYGGTAHFHQMQKIRAGCNILIATPGRLIDFLTRRAVSFVNLRHLIIDEADRMLDMNFLSDVESIIKHDTISTDDPPQVLLFSATFPEEVQRLARVYMRNYVFIAVGEVGAACTDVEQKFYLVSKYDKKEKLILLLQKLRRVKTLVFVEKKRTADIIAAYLSEKGFPSVSMHGDREQHLREEALRHFRSGRMEVLVATAVASRGLDIRDIGYVINFDLPHSVDEYVHRIGRTGRVGNRGLSISFYDPECDSSLAKGLARILVQAHQEIPPFLEEAAQGRDSGLPSRGREARDDQRRERNSHGYGRPPSSDEEW